MTPHQLKNEVESHNPDSRFFSKENMKISGDTMKNYRVRKVLIVGETGQIEAYELYRKYPVKHGLHHSSYFRTDNFKKVYGVYNATVTNI